jgi:hypothetical protein
VSAPRPLVAFRVEYGPLYFILPPGRVVGRADNDTEWPTVAAALADLRDQLALETIEYLEYYLADTA